MSASRNMLPPRPATGLLPRLWLAVYAASMLFTPTPSLAQAPIFMTAPPPLSRVEESAAPGSVAPPPAPIVNPAPAASAVPAAAAPVPLAPRLIAPLARPKDPAKREVVLRHLPNNVQGYRLAGEVGASEWPIFLTEDQARRRLQFQLGYLAAVSVMPERSTITLTINDQVVAETPVAAVQSVKTVIFNIPPGLIRAGFNSLTLSTSLRHRVDCSLEATNELWAQIDPTQTGFVFDEQGVSVSSLDELAALSPDGQGALPIRLVASADPNAAAFEKLMRVLQLVSIIGRFDQPVIDVGPLADGRYGVNLLVGTATEIAVSANGLVGSVDRPRVFVVPATAARRTTIIVTGATPAQVDEAMRQFLVAHKPRGTTAGLRAALAFPGYRVEGGQRVKLSDLGVKSEEFDGRLYRAAFNIIMPTDFYPADYGRATVRVAGGYAPGLTNAAQIVMYVNERTAVSLPLLKSTGEVFKDNPLPLPLGFLRPGLNRIEIEAHVPAPSDDSCDTLAGKDAANRFLFLNSTEIEIPAIARVGRLPDLAVTATGGFPFAGAARRPQLYLPRLDPKTLGAAATIVANLAIAAGRPIDFEITQKPPRRKEPVLAVAPYDAFDLDVLRKLEMPVDELSQQWRDKIGTEKSDDQTSTRGVDADLRYREALQNNFPMACRLGRASNIRHAGGVRPVDMASTGATESAEEQEPTIAAPAPDADEPARDLFQEWDERVRNEHRWTAKVGEWIAWTREWSKAKFTDAGEWIRALETSRVQQAMSNQTLLAVGQNILGEAGQDLWTVVTAPNADALADSVACLVDPRVSGQIGGRLSLLDVETAKVSVTHVTRTRFVVTQPLSPGNARLIAAGWLSLHSLYYVGAAVALALLLGLTTRVFVKNVGRKSG